jgi:mRNA-degrading endonuclease RelE of RelBE toxin-antitoxin system
LEILLTDEFVRRYKLLPANIQKKAEKQEKLFRHNPFHPSLHTEKLEPKGKQVWSFRIDRSYRVLFRFAERQKIIFLTVGPHDWIYKIAF